MRLLAATVTALSTMLALVPATAEDSCAELKRLQAMTADGFKTAPLHTENGYQAIVPALGAKSCIIGRSTKETLVRCTWDSASSLESRYQTLVEAVTTCFPDYGKTTLANPVSQPMAAATIDSDDERHAFDLELSHENGRWTMSLTVVVSS